MIKQEMPNNTDVSIIVPTYNESENILGILKSIIDVIPNTIKTQTIIVDDNSPDGTGKIVEEYIKNFKKITNNTIDVIHRKSKSGLSSAILNGIQKARGEAIIVMDSDFSHPPQIIPKLIEKIKKSHLDIAIASRYTTGGAVENWSIKRKLISKIATVVAKKSLGLKSNDPMSGFFAFKKSLIKGVNFDAIGYKLLLEILVKTKGARIEEIPYTFSNRKFGSSKLDFHTITDFIKSVWKLYRYGKVNESNEKRKSVRFASKAARFYTVGASGFLVNYFIALLFGGGITDFWYLHATILGIMASMTTNFILNKFWTFTDRDFNIKKTFLQYGKFITFSSVGALIQLGIVYSLVENTWSYPIALGTGVLTAAFSNFILNKRLTFKEKLWE